MHCHAADIASVLCVAIDRETGRAKGFAHIQFDSLEGAAKALGMSGQDFGGREIFIDTAQERTGGGGGGSFGGAAGGGGFERPPRSESYSLLPRVSCIQLKKTVAASAVFWLHYGDWLHIGMTISMTSQNVLQRWTVGQCWQQQGARNVWSEFVCLGPIDT